MTITLDKSKATCVGNDNRDLSYVVRLKFGQQTQFLVYFASFFGSNISTSDLKGILIRICDFGKYAFVRGDSVGHVVSALDRTRSPEIPGSSMTTRWIDLLLLSS